MNRTRLWAASTFVAVGLLTTVGPAAAGIADSPLPVLTAGAPTIHLYSVPGVIRIWGLSTFFSCTSTDAATIQVVIFGTGSAAGISISSNLGGLFSKGSARILATSKKLACTAFLADPGNAPPMSMVQLTIIAKLKQKAAN